MRLAITVDIDAQRMEDVVSAVAVHPDHPYGAANSHVKAWDTLAWPSSEKVWAIVMHNSQNPAYGWSSSPKELDPGRGKEDTAPWRYFPMEIGDNAYIGMRNGAAYQVSLGITYTGQLKSKISPRIFHLSSDDCDGLDPGLAQWLSSGKPRCLATDALLYHVFHLQPPYPANFRTYEAAPSSWQGLDRCMDLLNAGLYDSDVIDRVIKNHMAKVSPDWKRVANNWGELVQHMRQDLFLQERPDQLIQVRDHIDNLLTGNQPDFRPADAPSI